MPTNDFLVFSTNAASNVIDQPTYVAAGWRVQGFIAGIAQSAELNKVWRQGSFCAAGLSEYAMNETGENVPDDGNLAAYAARLRRAIRTSVTGGDFNGVAEAPINGVLYGRRNATWIGPIPTTADMNAAIAALDGRFVLKAGDTMTGYLTLAADPVNGMHAVTLNYLNARVGGLDNRFVFKTGDTMTGYLTLNADPVNGMHAVTLNYLNWRMDGATGFYDGRYVFKSGDTMSGYLTLVGDPQAGRHAVTLDYLNYRISLIPTGTNYLPLTGGSLYQGGADTYFRVASDQGRSSWIRTDVVGLREWQSGTSSNGDYYIMESGSERLHIAAGGTGAWTYVSGGLQVVADNVGGAPQVFIHTRGSVQCGITFSQGAGNGNQGNTAWFIGSSSDGNFGIQAGGGNWPIYIPRDTQSVVMGNGVYIGGRYSGGSYALQCDGPLWVNGTLSITPGGGNWQNFYSNGEMGISGNYASKNIAGPWVGPSDRRLKRDIEPYTRGLEAVLKINPVQFRFNGTAGTADDGEVHQSLLAQDVLPVMPEMVREWRPGGRLVDPETHHEDDTYLALDPTALTYALVNAVKELAGRMTTYESGGNGHRQPLSRPE